MTLAHYVRIVAQGKGRARALTMAEAQEAMTLVLNENAAPEAVGALLMVLRLRGETDAEIAGFAAALRQQTTATLPPADLDWPCYAAGRTRGAPLFLLAARLVADAGFRVSMHGWNSHQGTAADLRTALQESGLDGDGLRYDALETLHPVAFRLLGLRDTFGLRSCINTVLRMWNPSGSRASVQGVFHPSYRGLQSRAANLLGDQSLTVIKGGGGEFERNPAKQSALFGLRDGCDLDAFAPALLDENRRLNEPSRPIDLAALWVGDQLDDFSQATVIGTAALALWTAKAAPTVTQCEAQAHDLWADRLSPRRRVS
jgi:anthranilate phosphoribosyltransferase